MKKLIAFALAVTLVLGLLAGCGSGGSETTPPATSSTPATSNDQTNPPDNEPADPVDADVEYPYICTALRSLSNPYHQMCIKGMELYAAAMGIPEDHVLTITHDNDSQTLLTDMEALIIKYDSNIVFTVDPAQKTDLLSIADMCEKYGVYWCSIWSIPDAGVTIEDYDHWVAAINFGDVEAGYLAAKSMFEDMGGEGSIWICNGTAGSSSAVDRTAGLQQALEEYPNITIVGDEDCAFEKTNAYNSVSSAIVAYPEIKGIFCCNDNMACGAIEALDAKGLAGSVSVAGVNAIPDMVQYITEGKASATVSTDPLWQGGITLAMAVDAYLGKYDPSTVSGDMRYWVATCQLIDTANAQEFMDSYINGSPSYDYTDYYQDKYVAAGTYY